MTAVRVPGVAAQGRIRLPSAGAVAGALSTVVLLLLVGIAASEPARVRPVFALVAVVFLVGLATRSPAAGLLGLLVWLVALGTTRRLVSEIAPITHQDPLLLVSPLLLLLLAGEALRRGALRHRTRLSNGVLALCALTLLAAVNPLGGSIVGGIGGLLFVFFPMLAFWVGRACVDDRVLRWTMGVFAASGIVAAIYGLLQTTSGFPSWDRHWINDVSYASLNVGGVVRAFAMFSSSAEYAFGLGLAIVIWLVFGRRLTVLPLTVGALALLVPALVLESSRGIIIMLVATFGLLLGARSNLSLPMSAALGVLLLVALVVGLRHYGPTSYGSGVTASLLSHQVQGLSDPLNAQTSTAGIHLAMIENGVKSAFTHPLGRGLGTVTIAGSKFGGVSQGTEADPSNAGVGLGLLGLLAYVVVFVSGVTRAYRTARLRRDNLSLAALGVLGLTTFQWMNGGQYAVVLLPWLVLGWLDQQVALPGGDASAVLTPRRVTEGDGA